MTEIIRLDMRGVRCPMNYIQTKLRLDELAAGQVLEVLVDDGEAVRGIPLGFQEAGHEVLSVAPAESGHRIVIRKG